MLPSRLLRSSTFRLALVYMALFSASVLLLLGYIYWSTAGYMSRQTDATINAEISGLAEGYRLTGLAGLTEMISERLSRKPAGSSVYLLTDPSYNPLIGNLDHWPKVKPDAHHWLNFALAGPPGRRGIHRARARAFLLTGGFHLLVGRDMHDLQKAEALIVRTLAWGLALTLVLALLGGVLMSRSLVRRIEAINETCREIMVGDLARRIPTRNSGDDFDRLADNFNRMLDQIETLMKGVRQVSDSIAHDLRTPLARLRNRLELLREEGTPSPSQREILDQSVAEADGLLSTFAALLRIGQIESGSRQAGFTDLDLGSILGDVAELYEPLGEEMGVDLETRLGGVGPVRGDRDLLFQAFVNLLDNAVKYTPAGGRIAVHLQQDATGVRVTFADSGPGIPDEDREKVFQRFYRLEKSRTTPGNGLGLSLVAAVMHLHQAHIQLVENDPGLRVEILFPPTGTETRNA